ncbi:hypothetical protein D1AOALGA4SA_12063 [Olavius algarvensis Delta 1 endosymbiont]|nr:hypothetical protein D1AOALGA4SA_12063 [Olavius algarvensis Delta 1 endosymbiont]
MRNEDIGSRKWEFGLLKLNCGFRNADCGFDVSLRSINL